MQYIGGRIVRAARLLVIDIISLRGMVIIKSLTIIGKIMCKQLITNLILGKLYNSYEDIELREF